jgi:hypothetical protein
MYIDSLLMFNMAALTFCFITILTHWGEDQKNGL